MYCMLSSTLSKALIAAALLIIGIGILLSFGTDRSANDNLNKVVKPISYVKEEYLRCIQLEAKDTEKGNCLNALAQFAYDTYEVSDVVSVLDTLSYPDRDHWCHEMMHYMGWRSYGAEKDISKSFMQSAELCDNGMYHGVMEEFLRRQGIEGDIADLIQNTCSTSLEHHPDRSQGTMSLCYHGLGHGLMYITSADLKRSLDYCDLLSEADSYACYGGAFMEHIASKSVGPLSEKEKPDLADVSYCDELSDKQKAACLSRQGFHNIMITKGDVGEAMRLCLAIREENQEGCFQGVGGNTPTPSRSHADAALACKDAIGVAATSYQHCIKGALGFVIQLDHGDIQGMLDFCAATEESEQYFCYERAGDSAVYWLKDGESIEEKCALFPHREAEEACLQGAKGGTARF